MLSVPKLSPDSLKGVLLQVTENAVTRSYGGGEEIRTLDTG